ncbi:MAG: ABC transporter permease subunit [Gemmatimonadaceae bacterium]|nr:ABC transporter permease subunit [Gemmatimonadaceae bacterium]NUR33584.1 ABC transporter permease subunit [Gemmatimonadaceae bacterium]
MSTIRTRRGRSLAPRQVIRALLLVGLIVSALGPLLLLVLWSVSGRWLYPALLPTQLDLGGWRALRAGTTWLALLTSAALASATGVVGCALALPLGRALSRVHGWRRHVGAAAAFLPVAAPPLALGTGLQVVLLSAGLGGTATGVFLAHLVPAVGYLALFFLGTFTLFDARVEAEARTLGATPWQTWRYVLLPLLRTPIAEAVALGFLISWSQFALTLVIGGGAVRALPLEVFAFVRAGEDRAAAVSALLLVVPPVMALAALRWAARRTAVVPA